MKIKQAEGITGYEIQSRPTALSGVLLYCLEPNIGPDLYGRGKNENMACHALVHCVYKWHCALVDERAERKCERCCSTYMLAHHHKKFRSKERDDRVDNLELLCWQCHMGPGGAHSRKSK